MRRPPRGGLAPYGSAGRFAGLALELADPDRPANLARFIFGYDRDSGFYADPEGMSRACVGNLRAETGRTPSDHVLSDLIGELLAHSDEFRALWAAHDVEYYRTGIQPFRHPSPGN
jgi:hypothetical protein